MADPVVDKQSRNFCEYFSFSREPFVAAGAVVSREAQARAKLTQLFGGIGGATGGGSAEARKKLEGLFKKPRPPEEGTKP